MEKPAEANVVEPAKLLWQMSGANKHQGSSGRFDINFRIRVISLAEKFFFLFRKISCTRTLVIVIGYKRNKNVSSYYI